MSATQQITAQSQQDCHSSKLHKKINDDKDILYFKTRCPAYRNILTYIELLCERILGSSNKTLSSKYALQHDIFIKCSDLLTDLERLCDETDLSATNSISTMRFGHMAFRDWFDRMKDHCKEFVNAKLAPDQNEQFRAELFAYLTESFGNRMRIDYGTGHELNFIIFTIGLVNIVGNVRGDVTHDRLKDFVSQHGWDIHALFAHRYLRLCRRIQVKFRLEPAGSRGVYNMDDFQFLPFLFGVAQLVGVKYISSNDYYLPDQVDMFKQDYVFFEAIDFTLKNKRGPFNEHSYTLWCLTNLGSWENIYRRIKTKFTDDVLTPFPIVQHLMFGEYILKWSTN